MLIVGGGCALFLLLAFFSGAVAFVLARVGSSSAPAPVTVQPESPATRTPTSPETPGLGDAPTDPQNAAPEFDVKRFDVQGFLPEAEKRAQQGAWDATR